MKQLRVKRDISIQSGPCQATKPTHPRYGRTLQPAQKLLLTSTDEAVKMSRTQKTIFGYNTDDLRVTVRDLDRVNSSRGPWKQGRQVNISSNSGLGVCWSSLARHIGK